MATKRRRGTTWHYTIRRAKLLPQPIYLSFDNEEEGDEYVKRLEALLDRGVVPDEFQQTRTARRDLRSNIRRYLDAQHVSIDDKKLLAIVQARLPVKLDLSELTFTWATAWVTDLKRVQNLSPSTIRHHVGALSRALDWLSAHGDIPFNPLKLLPKGYSSYTPADEKAVKAIEGEAKEDNERDRRIEPNEETAIRYILSGHKPEGRQRALTLHNQDALILLFDMALETAMRLREMYTLDRDQVDLRRRTIFLDRTKNGDKRQVPISSVLFSKLTDYTGNYGGRLFPWWDGDLNPKVLEQVTARLSRQWARIFSAAGADGLRWHDTRHEATSRIYERTTLTDVQIASITGHKDPRQLKRYANLRASTLAEQLW